MFYIVAYHENLGKGTINNIRRLARPACLGAKRFIVFHDDVR